MSENNLCCEYECCWEFVPTALRIKYEKGESLSIEELEEIISSLQSSPSYWDTLDESDAFFELDYYRRHGISWQEDVQED